MTKFTHLPVTSIQPPTASPTLSQNDRDIPTVLDFNSVSSNGGGFDMPYNR